MASQRDLFSVLDSTRLENDSLGAYVLVVELGELLE